MNAENYELSEAMASEETNPSLTPPENSQQYNDYDPEEDEGQPEAVVEQSKGYRKAMRLRDAAIIARNLHQAMSDRREFPAFAEKHDKDIEHWKKALKQEEYVEFGITEANAEGYGKNLDEYQKKAEEERNKLAKIRASRAS